MEAPTRTTIYARPMFLGYVRGYTPKIWPYMVQYLHFRILEFPLIFWLWVQNLALSSLVNSMAQLGSWDDSPEK